MPERKLRFRPLRNRAHARAVLRLMKTSLLTSAAALLALAAPASAQEIFGGAYFHDVKTGLTVSGIEDGADFQLGWRGGRIGALSILGTTASPHAFVSLNSAGDTHFASAGVNWKIGKTVYLRPGIGLAVHTGPGRVVPGDNRIDFGSRVLFAPEIGAGVQVSERLSVEASWVHLSHAKIFGPQNPGLDTIGMRLNYRFR
jgi:hypothetical protein